MPKVTPHRVENGTALKRCSKCKDWKPVGEYYKAKAKWDGLRSACKQCNKTISLKYREVLANNIKYKEQNKERCRLYLLIK